MRRVRGRLAAEDGAITIIVALLLVVLLGVTAVTIDLGRTRHARQQLQDAVDSASIAAADFLPVRDTAGVAAVKSIAERIAVGSATGIVPADVATNFLCIVKVSAPGATGNTNTTDIGTDVGSACGPATAGTWSAGAAGWVTKPGSTISTHACFPDAGDLCNAVKVKTSRTLPYLFAPALGISTGSTGAVQSVACQGACKPTANPLDVAIVLDRTASMSDDDVANVKKAALEVLKVYEPAEQSVSLFVLPYSQVGNKCKVQSPQEYADSSVNKWLVSPLATDYRNASSDLVTKINCLERAASPTIKVSGNQSPSQSHTNLGDPMGAAADYLRQSGRPSVPDVIIFMTDGQANQPWAPSLGYNTPCGYAKSKADTARDQGSAGAGKAEIFTVGYGIETEKCPDTSGAYVNAYATTTLADMATPTTTGSDPSKIGDNKPGGCVEDDENTDGDHYYCSKERDTGIAEVFRQIAIATVKYSRMLDID